MVENTLLKKKKKHPVTRNLPSYTKSGMVTIVLTNLKSKSLLRKEIYGDFEKERGTH